MRVKLTVRLLRSAMTCARMSPMFMDDEVIGFGIQVCKTGRKCFGRRPEISPRRFLTLEASWIIDCARKQVSSWRRHEYRA